MLIQKDKYRFFKVIFLSLIMIASLAGVTHSAVMTVKQLGGGDYESISEAIANAFPGDTIEVYAGRYEEAVIIDIDLILIGMGPQTVEIFSPDTGITVNDGRQVSITGFTITSANDGILLIDESKTIIKNNCIVSNGKNGIFTVYSHSATGYSTIINNTIAFNGESGIRQNGSSIHLQTFYVHNNIIYKNKQYGIYRINSGIIVNTYNNVFQNRTDNYFNMTQHPTDISIEPIFMNESTGDFTLQESSMCRNAGRPGSADTDPDGSQNDMGAYGSPDCASFWPYPPGAPIITNLNATPTSVAKGSPITIEATGEVYE